jgi:hypothetical protein
MPFNKRWQSAIATAVLLTSAGITQAADRSAGNAGALPLAGAGAQNQAAPAPAPIKTSDLGAPLTDGQLLRLRGGDSQVGNDLRVEGTVNDTTADRIVSGGNRIDGGAFAQSSGINTVIQNSGSNVLIQNAMIVNVQFTDPTR